MIDPIAGLRLVIAQSPEVARSQTPVLQQMALANAQAPAVASYVARAAKDVASIQPAAPPLPVSASRPDPHTRWSYMRQPRKARRAGPVGAIASDAVGTLGSLVDAAA